MLLVVVEWLAVLWAGPIPRRESLGKGQEVRGQRISSRENWGSEQMIRGKKAGEKVKEKNPLAGGSFKGAGSEGME